MKSLLTPRQIATAIEVSESSVKRWCDKGVIPTQYTAGGHRRVPISGLLQFLKASGHRMVRPEILGLPATVGAGGSSTARSQEQLLHALLAGEEELARLVVLDLFLGDHSLAVICDQVIGPAFLAIGEQWECGDAEVFQERRACEIGLRLLFELRSMLPPPPSDAPLAIGGTAEGDPYSLATTMVELVLREIRWNAISLGDSLPFETLQVALIRQTPRLFWLSVSHLANEDDFVRRFNQLHQDHQATTFFVLGGNALITRVRRRVNADLFCRSMQDLQDFARSRMPA